MRNLLCLMFGHRPAFGYCNVEGEGYMWAGRVLVDGVNRHHMSLWSDCQRCGVRYKVGNVHVPQVYVDATGYKVPKVQ